MANITVLTPTYNRKDNLIKLYKSLLEQNYKDFLWLIIDDGSTDSTEELVGKWEKESDITIMYKKKKNGGKHTALNYSYAFIKTPLTFIVDSDDYLTTDAIEVIENKYYIYRMESDICGFSFMRGKPDGSYLSSSSVPEEALKETYCKCRINRHITGDMAEVWYTRCLQEYPFPVFKGEKFLGEDFVWLRMSDKYKMRFFNDVIYISDYLPGGLTNNRRIHNIKSPKGCVARAEVFLNADIKTRFKIKPMMQYFIYGKFAGIGFVSQFMGSINKYLALICWIPSILLYINFKKKHNIK